MSLARRLGVGGDDGSHEVGIVAFIKILKRSESEGLSSTITPESGSK